MLTLPLAGCHYCGDGLGIDLLSDYVRLNIGRFDLMMP